MKATTIQEQLIEITNNLGMSGELLSSVFYYAHRIADYKTPANQVGMKRCIAMQAGTNSV